MATNPFINTVGLKGVTPDNVTPSLFINDLPGMSTELVEAVTDEEDESSNDPTGTKATWERLQRTSLEELETLLASELSKSADFQYAGAKTFEFPDGEESNLVLMPAGILLGYSIVAPVSATDELFIATLQLDCANIEPVTTFIEAFSPTGKELFSNQVVVNPDFNSFDVKLPVKSQFGRNVIVFVGIDCSELSLRTIGSGQSWDCKDFTMQAVAMPVSSDHKVADLSEVTKTGILLSACVRRSLIDQVAKYEDRLRSAYWYLLGGFLVEERLKSGNINRFTNTNRLEMSDTVQDWRDKAKMRICPVARDIIKELRSTPVLQADPDNQPGYYQGGFV